MGLQNTPLSLMIRFLCQILHPPVPPGTGRENGCPGRHTGAQIFRNLTEALNNYKHFALSLHENIYRGKDSFVDNKSLSIIYFYFDNQDFVSGF